MELNVATAKVDAYANFDDNVASLKTADRRTRLDSNFVESIPGQTQKKLAKPWHNEQSINKQSTNFSVNLVRKFADQVQISRFSTPQAGVFTGDRPTAVSQLDVRL